jgi:hypothetical protein
MIGRMLVDLSGDDRFFQAISRHGTIVVSGVLHRQRRT